MQLAAEIDGIVADAIAQRIFPGAVVLIARGADIMHYSAYGTTMYGDPGAQPVRLDTIYDIASLTKMFTATAALRLCDAGILELSAPVAAYLPDFAAPDVTIQHLLTHTSGLDIRLSALRHAGRLGMLEAIYRTTPTYPPGTRVAYTNVNSLLLGEIVSRLHGGPLEAALDELVIGALGLRDTLFCPPAQLLPRIAPTERDDEWRGALVHGSVHDESTHALGGVAGHAGLFSTALDIHAFCCAWLPQAVNVEGLKVEGYSQCLIDRSVQRSTFNISTFNLLKSETIGLATTNHTPGLNAACGLGWMLDRRNFMGDAPAGTFGHTGFTGPAMIIVPSHRLIMVLLSNRVYPRRRAFEHHPVTAAILRTAVQAIAHT